jgi:hypothetical protein
MLCVCAGAGKWTDIFRMQYSIEFLPLCVLNSDHFLWHDIVLGIELIFPDLRLQVLKLILVPVPKEVRYLYY